MWPSVYAGSHVGGPVSTRWTRKSRLIDRSRYSRYARMPGVITSRCPIVMGTGYPCAAAIHGAPAVSSRLPRSLAGYSSRSATKTQNGWPSGSR